MLVREDNRARFLPKIRPSAFLVTVIVEPSAVGVLSMMGLGVIGLPAWSLKVTPGGKTLVMVRFRRFWERVTSVRLVLSAKAKSPRDVTVDGMEIEVSLLS